MAILQKKPQVSSSIPLYTTGLTKNLLIVGLGNIGKQYENTRHNVGFLSIDHFAKQMEFSKMIQKKDLKCTTTRKQFSDSNVILCKPTTMMNLSGQAVQSIANFYRIKTENIVVVYDELDVPFGQIRMRLGGSSAGHNGIKSISEILGENFGRIRVGIQTDNPIRQDASTYVLAKFKTNEQEQLPNLYKELTSILTEYIYRGELQPETRSFMI
jgi:peptidyl-tRNA hydrolase, PTH1 family